MDNMADDRIHCANCVTKCDRRNDALKRCQEYRGKDGAIGARIWPNLLSAAIPQLPKKKK